jgi:(S)-citramalyl-CoA lyase
MHELQALLGSSANPDYLILPKCNSSGLIDLVGNLLREAKNDANHCDELESFAKG